MKNLIFCFFIMIFAACGKPVGTIENVDKGNNEQIEVYRYYFEEGSYVYVSRFKKCPNVVTTTWNQRHGKVNVQKGNVVVYENDSVKIILKK